MFCEIGKAVEPRPTFGTFVNARTNLASLGTSYPPRIVSGPTGTAAVRRRRSLPLSFASWANASARSVKVRSRVTVTGQDHVSRSQGGSGKAQESRVIKTSEREACWIRLSRREEVRSRERIDRSSPVSEVCRTYHSEFDNPKLEELSLGKLQEEYIPT